jgi:cobalt-zinc-cadmium efflux system outer membrane protein
MRFARPFLTCSWALALLFVINADAASAAGFDEPRGPLTLEVAIAAALQRNPALQSAEFELRALTARRIQAAQRPAAEVGIELENMAGSGNLRGTRSLETTLTLSQVIELGDKRTQRMAIADFERDRSSVERNARQLDVLAAVTRRFIDVAETQQQLLIARDAATLASKTLKHIEQRVAAARSPVAEQNRAAIALGRAQLEERKLTQQLLGAHRQLAALWGSSAPRFGDAQAELFELPPVDDFPALMAKLSTQPDFLRFASEARLRDAQWQLALAEAKSDVRVGAGLRRFEETGDTGIVLSFSMPLPLANRNSGAIREAAIRRDQVEVDRKAAFDTTQAALFEFYQSLQQARFEVTALRGQLIPQAEAALQQTQYGFERGRFSYLELADVQRELLLMRREAIAAAATYHRLLAEIERLTREPLALATNDFESAP